LLRQGLSDQVLMNEIKSNFRVKSSHHPSYQQFTKANESMDTDMAFSHSLRSNGIFMYVTNLKHFGHLIDNEGYETHHYHNDLYEIKRNQLDWEKQYIHEDYRKVLQDDYEIEQPCPDVYWFPVVSPLFCKHLIEEMENYGQWSDGKNQVNILLLD